MSMLPVVAIVGRPNVGKSTFFNRLTKSRAAIVSPFPGMTRDRQYGEANLFDRHFIVIDTGGMTDSKDMVDQFITQQAQQAIEEADCILFVVDGRTDVTTLDQTIAKQLKRYKKPMFTVVNKMEGLDVDTHLADFYKLGGGKPHAISATHGLGIEALIEAMFPKPNETAEPKEQDGIRLAIVGRPNVGKSTLTNRMLGEERVIVHDLAGTTRDSIFVPLERFGKHYTLIDTAGVRKRSRVSQAEAPEKFSVVKTLQAIENANVVLYLVNGREGISDQDLKLLGFILECGKAIVIGVNKWDGMSDAEKDRARATLDRHLDFLSFARVHFISALHGTGVGNLFASVDEAYESAMKKLSTPTLTRILQKAVTVHAPPIVKGRRIKLRYAHPGGNNPPIVVIHGTQLDALPDSYSTYLAHTFQKYLRLHGTPVRIELKNSENPFAETRKKSSNQPKTKRRSGRIMKPKGKKRN